MTTTPELINRFKERAELARLETEALESENKLEHVKSQNKPSIFREIYNLFAADEIMVVTCSTCVTSLLKRIIEKTQVRV